MPTQVTMPVLGLTMEEGTVEVPSPASGVLRRITAQPGTAVPVRTVIAEIGEAGEFGEPGEAVASPVRTESAAKRLFATPRARMRAREMGGDLNAIAGSGPHGRVVEADVIAVASDARLEAAPPAVPVVKAAPT